MVGTREVLLTQDFNSSLTTAASSRSWLYGLAAAFGASSPSKEVKSVRCTRRIGNLQRSERVTWEFLLKLNKGLLLECLDGAYGIQSSEVIALHLQWV
jgi:hypothetical protein